LQITFDWERNRWQSVSIQFIRGVVPETPIGRYDIVAIESSLSHQNKLSDPSDLTFLMSHFEELPEEARTYITWATFFGETQVLLVE
jgi:hypothetical protein